MLGRSSLRVRGRGSTWDRLVVTSVFMRGRVKEQTSMLMLASPEERIPQDHPIRRIKKLADEALREMSPLFDAMYEEGGRISVPPERLLKATLLMALFSVRSERQFCEQLDYNLMFRWFLDMDMAESTFVPTVFSKNRQRLLDHDAGAAFLGEVVRQAKKARLMSAEHFSVDGTLIDAWASMKSFRPKDEKKDDDDDGNGWGDFRGTKRSNDTHESKTDPDAKLMRKGNGQPAKLSFSANVLMENRSGLVVDMSVVAATGHAERDTALAMLENLGGTARITVGADRGYDTADFVADCRHLGVSPHVAQHTNRRRSAIDRRTTQHPGYAVSQRIRRRIESIFGWMKTTGGFARTRVRGIARTQLAAQLVGAAYNLLRIAHAVPETA
jgi:transposase